jgi:hypothetical protein
MSAVRPGVLLAVRLGVFRAGIFGLVLALPAASPGVERWREVVDTPANPLEHPAVPTVTTELEEEARAFDDERAALSGLLLILGGSAPRPGFRRRSLGRGSRLCAITVSAR